DAKEAAQERIDQALSMRLGRGRRQIGHGIPQREMAQGSLSLPGTNWGIGAGPRLARALVAAAQLKVALAAVIGERAGLRAASINAQLHAVDLAGRRARPATAALIGVRLPRIGCGTGILLCHGAGGPSQEGQYDCGQDSGQDSAY